jgi:hypothetical protein
MTPRWPNQNSLGYREELSISQQGVPRFRIFGQVATCTVLPRPTKPSFKPFDLLSPSPPRPQVGM